MPHVSTAKLIRGAPYFPVADVSATGAYYREVFGFETEYAGGDPPEFAICSRDGCALMFRRVTDPLRIVPSERQGGTWDAFFWVSGVEVLYAELAAKGAVFAYGLTVQPYHMKEFAVRDPQGHVLGFGETWPPAP